MNKKYTKNEHMRYLNDGATPIDPEANSLMKARLLTPRNTSPKCIGQWLQATHRAVFNRDFEKHVEKHSLSKHCMS